MAMPRLTGVGVLPQRVDFRRDVPRAGLQSGRDQNAGETADTGETNGWATSDAVYDRHEQGLQRRDRWAGFLQHRGWSGTMAETMPSARAMAFGPAPFQAPPKQLGEPPLNYFMRFSAALNEYYRSHGERVGVGPYGSYTEASPMPRSRRGRHFRRTFSLE